MGSANSMDSRQLDVWVQRASLIRNFIKYASLLEGFYPLKHIRINQNMFLIDEGIDEYNQLLSQIFQKTKCSIKMTRESVDRRLKELFSQGIVKGTSDDFNVKFCQFVADIENYNVEQVIYLPLDNIEMQDLERVRFGKFSLIKMTEKRMAILAKKVKKTIEQTVHSEEDKPIITKTFIQYNVEPLRGRVCVEYRCVAEPDLVEAYAHEEALGLIDVLRYAIPKIYSSLYPAYFFPSQDLRSQRKKQSNKSSYRTSSRGIT